MKLTAKNTTETREIASNFAKKLKGGEILALSGDLGAGKTTFTQGLASALGINQEIKSPTFTLMNIYKTNINSLKLVHIDTYRMESEKQLIEIGVEDYLGEPDTISVVEWPEKMKSILQNKNVVQIKLHHTQNNTREIELPF